MKKNNSIVGKNGIYIFNEKGEIEIITEEEKASGKPKVTDKLLKAIKTAIDQKKKELDKEK